MDKNFSKLSVLDLRVWVHLGCGDEEKFNPQPVSFNIEIEFKSGLRALITDRIEDAVCYSELASSIKSHCENKRFNLIEHLTLSVYEVIEELLIPHHDIISLVNITAHKISPPVQDVHGGVSFTYLAVPANKKGSV